MVTSVATGVRRLIVWGARGEVADCAAKALVGMNGVYPNALGPARPRGLMAA
jgi:hypothetical protein